MKKIYISFAIIAAIAIIGTTGYWMGSRSANKLEGSAKAGNRQESNNPAPNLAASGIAVNTAIVATTPLPQGISAVGSLRSDEAVIIRPEVTGRITEILFTEGQRVEKNAVLVRLDTAVQRAELEQARASYTLNKSKQERAIDLEKKGFISSQAREEADNNFRVSQASLDLSMAKLAKLELRAPFAGVVGLRSVSIGDYVKEGQDIVNLEAIDTLKADFKVPEIYLSQIHPGQQLQIALDAIPGKSFNGQVFAINPLVDQNGRSIVIRAAVRNINGQLRPGMFARIRLFTRENADAIVIAEQAIIPAGDDFFIYKVVDGKAQRVKVEIGQRREGIVEITRGLVAGDTIVVEGQLKLREGVTVHSNAQQPTPSSSIAGKEIPNPSRGKS